MIEWLLPLAMSGISAGSSAYAANIASQGQEDANAQNLAIADAQMKFQENAFRNRHQWEVEDLRAAGLNPILSATGGQAPVPSGASATMQSTKRDSSEYLASSSKGIVDAINGILSALKTGSETGNINKESKILENKIGQSASDKTTAENQAIKSKYDAIMASELARDQKYKADMSKISSAKAANELLAETPELAKWRHRGESLKTWLDTGGEIMRIFNRNRVIYSPKNNKPSIPYRDYGRR